MSKSEIGNKKTLTMATEEPVTKMLVVKSNKLIEAQSKLHARAQKVLAACISLINPLADYEDNISVELTDSQLEHLTGIAKRNLYQFIDETAKDFVSTPIATPGQKEGKIDYIGIAHRAEYDPDERIFKLTFHPDIKEELVNLKAYTSTSLRELVSLRSKYSMRLFELIEKNFNKKGQLTQFARIPLDKLQFALCIESQSLLKSYSRLREKVLEPAIAEINEKTRYSVVMSAYKRGRFVAGITVQMKRSKKGVALQLIESASIDDLLKQYDIAIDEASVMINNHGEEKVLENLKAMYELEAIKGVTITNFAGYLRWMLNVNYASLPDIANPESDINRANEERKAFVKHAILPIWWKLSDDLRQDIVETGSIENHLTTSLWWDKFKLAWDNQSPEAARESIDLEKITKDCLEAWSKCS